jgi:hypothetical protein
MIIPRLFIDDLEGASLQFLVGRSRGHQRTAPADDFKYFYTERNGGPKPGIDFTIHKRFYTFMTGNCV